MTGYLRIEAKRISRNNTKGSTKSWANAISYIIQKVLLDRDGSKVSRIVPNRHKSIDYALFLPENAPYRDIQDFIDAAEASEKRRDAHLANQYIVSVPNVLSPEAQQGAFKNIILELRNNLSMHGIFAIHDMGGHNPHAHIVIPSRPMDKNGNFALTKPHLTKGQSRNWLIKIRKTIAAAVNEVIEKYDYDFKVDHRSYKARGIARIPKLPINPYYPTEYGGRMKKYNEEIDRINKELEQQEKQLKDIFSWNEEIPLEAIEGNDEGIAWHGKLF